MTTTERPPIRPHHPVRPGVFSPSERLRNAQVARIAASRLAGQVDALRLDAVVRGLCVSLSPFLAAPHPPVTRDRPGPSQRQLEVLRLIADGRSNDEIAQRLYMTLNSVKTHNRRLFAQLGARDRAHAVAIGYQRGLIGGDTP